MKKVLFCTIFLARVLFGNDSVNLIEIMQNLEYATSLISKGFFRDRMALIEDGRKLLKKNILELKKINPEFYLHPEKNQLRSAIFNNISQIDEQAYWMGEHLEKKEMNKAYESFERVMINCFKCHTLTR